MEYVIAKEFKTLIHRFKVGDAVAESYDLQPFTFYDLKERGFIVVKAAERAAYVAPAPRTSRTSVRSED